MSNDQIAGGSSGGGCGGEFMLFGFRVVVDSMRKSVSLNNLSQYEHRLDYSPPPPRNTTDNKDLSGNLAAGYASADDVLHHSSTTAATVNRERKRGVPWTEDEHKLFLAGLQKVGKGDWRGISRNFVKTRTPTQVASHAQKYFLRRNNQNRRRRRSSLFDITTDSVAAKNDDDQMITENTVAGGQTQTPSPASPPSLEISKMVKFSVSPTPIYQFTTHDNYPEVSATLSPTTAITGSKSSSMVDFDLNHSDSSSAAFDPLPLSLGLSLSTSTEVANNATTYQVMQGLGNSDRMIRVV